MSKVILKQAGLFYVEGEGFSSPNKPQATKLTTDEAHCAIACAAKFGNKSVTTEAANVSFGVVYIRKDFIGLDGVHGAQKAVNPSLNQVDPSKRRFATRDEADKHGSRFRERRADRGDEAGTAGHIGFYVVETSDEVNSKVNWKTGLTNSIKE